MILRQGPRLSVLSSSIFRSPQPKKHRFDSLFSGREPIPGMGNTELIRRKVRRARHTFIHLLATSRAFRSFTTICKGVGITPFLCRSVSCSMKKTVRPCTPVLVCGVRRSMGFPAWSTAKRTRRSYVWTRRSSTRMCSFSRSPMSSV